MANDLADRAAARLAGIMTGMILAMARGAGEVAPMMLVGAMKSAPDLPIDGVFPFVHPERSFMHLGFHIYDLGFIVKTARPRGRWSLPRRLLLIASWPRLTSRPSGCETASADGSGPAMA